MTYPLKFTLVMLAVALADVCWTLYFVEVERRRSVAAGFWSAMIMVAGTFVTTSYIDDHRFAPAAILGAFLGTSGIVAWKRRTERAV